MTESQQVRKEAEGLALFAKTAADNALASIKSLMTPSGIASLFCELSDEDQARTIVEIGRIMETWPGGGRTMQAHMVGRKMKEAGTFGYSGKEFVREVAEAFGEFP